MANSIYKYGHAEIWRQNLDYLAGNIKVAYVNVTGTGTLYTADVAADQFLSDIPGASIAATSPNLTGKAISDAGIASANSFVLTSVPADGSDYEAFVVYLDTGVAATSTLIAYIDTGTTMQQTPDGNNINVTLPAALFTL